MTSKPFHRALSCVLVLVCLVGSPSWACLNDYKPNVAAIARSKTLLEQLTQHPTAEPWIERRDRLRKVLANGGDFRVKNDLATTLTHTGEAAEAVRLLEEVEAEKPGLYFTAANLGTAYELSGDDRKALEWIGKGIERNPDAHNGTEWLHVRILEAKLALAGDPAWLDTHSILDGSTVIRNGGQENSGPTGKNVIGNRGEKVTMDQTREALVYQLHERLQFVKPPDKVVGVLLVDLGDIVAHESVGIGAAAGIYNLASDYLPEGENLTDDPLASQVMARSVSAGMAQRIPSRTRRFLGDPISDFAALSIIGILIALPIIALRRRLIARRAGTRPKEEVA